MKFIKILYLLVCVFPIAARAYDDCLPYKLTPKITLDVPEWSKEVVQPLQHMDLLHGNVLATLVDNYDIVADITNIEDGYCVSLKSVDATVGYSNFLVQIDIRHMPESCTYNAILSHEDQHIRAYLSVIDDFTPELMNAVYTAADSITPIFVQNASDIDAAITELNAELQAHPDLILVKQKIKAAEEIRTKRVAQHDHGQSLQKCFIQHQ